MLVVHLPTAPYNPMPYLFTNTINSRASVAHKKLFLITATTIRSKRFIIHYTKPQSLSYHFNFKIEFRVN